jgi:hypothetical protein
MGLLYILANGTEAPSSAVPRDLSGQFSFVLDPRRQGRHNAPHDTR